MAHHRSPIVGLTHGPPPPPRLGPPRLGSNSWGLTMPIMAMPPKLGGCHLPQPRTFLLWQHATPFVLSRQEPQRVPALSKHHLESWAKLYGISLDGRYLPWLQLGPIPWITYPFLGTSCKAFPLLCKTAPVPTRWPECHCGTRHGLVTLTTTHTPPRP